MRETGEAKERSSPCGVCVNMGDRFFALQRSDCFFQFFSMFCSKNNRFFGNEFKSASDNCAPRLRICTIIVGIPRNYSTNEMKFVAMNGRDSELYLCCFTTTVNGLEHWNGVTRCCVWLVRDESSSLNGYVSNSLEGVDDRSFGWIDRVHPGQKNTQKSFCSGSNDKQ